MRITCPGSIAASAIRPRIGWSPTVSHRSRYPSPTGPRGASAAQEIDKIERDPACRAARSYQAVLQCFTSFLEHISWSIVVIIHYDTPAVGAPTATFWSGMTFPRIVIPLY